MPGLEAVLFDSLNIITAENACVSQKRGFSNLEVANRSSVRFMDDNNKYEGVTMGISLKRSYATEADRA
ncbi:hypothetical protein J6590_089973 [Homalodisca vitripennis]|nr:hypothetical protein J6590_089973 [Homalodisca vitripennis]